MSDLTDDERAELEKLRAQKARRAAMRSAYQKLPHVRERIYAWQKEYFKRPGIKERRERKMLARLKAKYEGEAK
jgi:Tfp pilus assembly protein PilE